MQDIFKNIVVRGIEPKISTYIKGQKYTIKNRERSAFTLSISGTRHFMMNGKTFVCNPSTAVFIPQGSSYKVHDITDGSHYFIEVTCDNPYCDEIMSFPLQNPQKCRHHLETLMDKHFYVRNRLRELAVFYEVLYSVSSTLPVHRTLNIITKYVEKNISNSNLSNTVLAEQGCISEVYLRKLFLLHYNTTPKQYVIDTRIRTAQLLLTQSTMTVSEIAEKCGFSSSNHFCRAFKNKMNMTPTQYAGLRKSPAM